MGWLADNYATLLIVLGIALLAIEVGLLGFSVFILFFIGLACIITGLLMSISLLPGTLPFALGGVAVFTLAFTFALWKPLKHMQNKGITHEVRGDFIGHSFVLDDTVSPTQFSTHRMSGVNWKVKSRQPIPAGTLVEVTKVEVGELTVIPRSH